MGKPSTPPAPNYAAAAQETAAGNLEVEKYRTQANRVNQYNPYGSIEYSSTPQTKFDEQGYSTAQQDAYNKAYGNSVVDLGWGTRQLSEAERQAAGNAARAGVNRSQYEKTHDIWSMRQTLSPEQQKLFDQNNQINQSLGDVAQQGVGYVSQALDKPLSFDGMYNVGTPEQLQQEASDAAYNASTRYLDPQFKQQGADLENQLANQGITRGSEAWNREMQNAAMQKEQAYGQARNQAYNQGMAGSQQMYNQGAGLRQQQIAEAQTLQQNPINMLNAVRTGSQMQVAQMPQQQNVAQMGQVAGPDMLGAANAQGQYAQGIYNAQSAGQSGMMGSLGAIGGGIAGGMMGGPAGAMYGASAGGAMGRGMSDPRTKENVVHIGKHNNLNMYQWTYKPEFVDHEFGGKGTRTGYMADEVLVKYPDAISYSDGYMVVDYAKLETLNG